MRRGKISFVLLIALVAITFGGTDANADNSGVLDVNSILNSNPSVDTIRIVKLLGYSEAFVPGEDHASSPIMSGMHNVSSYVDGYDACFDARPADTNNPFHFRFYYNGNINGGEEPNISVEFSFPYDPNYIFGNRKMIFQQEDTNGINDSNGYRGDARAEIAAGDANVARIGFGKLPAGTYSPSTPFLHLRLDFDKPLGDLDNDNVVNFKDYAILAERWREEERSIADISGPNDVPDMKVENYDLAIIARDWLEGV